MRAALTVITFLFFLCFANPAFAVSITLSNYPSTITQDAFTVTASISGAITATNYLKLEFFKDGTDNYFGETFNNADWYGGSTYSQYLSISIQSGIVWSGNIQGRIGSPTTGQYDGSGAYKMRIRRYTGSGGYTSSEADNSSVVVSIVVPTPTLVPTNTQTPGSTSTPTPAATSTPTSAPTKTPTPVSSTSVPTPKSSIEPTSEVSSTSVLGENTESGLNISPPENDLISNQTKKPDAVF